MERGRNNAKIRNMSVSDAPELDQLERLEVLRPVNNNRLTAVDRRMSLPLLQPVDVTRDKSERRLSFWGSPPPRKTDNADGLSLWSLDTETYGDSAGSPGGPRARRHSIQTRLRRRLIFKNGECNISLANIDKRRQRYLADIFTTLVDIKWRWILLMFTAAFILSWLFFALIWWVICFAHGDFDNFGKEGYKPCVLEVNDFTTALLFSIETQHTIGYGSRQTTPHCPEAVMVMMLQSVTGVIIQSLMTGIVFAKLSRPKNRAETILFSKHAVICQRDGELHLVMRIGDIRKSRIVGAGLRAILVRKKITREGELLPFFQHDVQVGMSDRQDGTIFLVWPMLVTHKIDENSPFWELSADDLYRQQFELVIILEGTVESTGMTTQVRTSYLPWEILWGQRFVRLETYQKENGRYQIDYSHFHTTIPISTPQCSAKTLSQIPDDENDEGGTSLRNRREGSPSSPPIFKRNGIAQTNGSMPTTPEEEDFDQGNQSESDQDNLDDDDDCDSPLRRRRAPCINPPGLRHNSVFPTTLETVTDEDEMDSGRGTDKTGNGSSTDGVPEMRVDLGVNPERRQVGTYRISV